MAISDMMASFTKQFCIMEKTMVPDGEGGSFTNWRDGMVFDMAVRHDTTILAQQAEGQGTASTYTFLVNSGIHLAFPDVVKRMEDGQIFQITSDSADSFTPATSGLKLAAVTAKKWRLPV